MKNFKPFVVTALVALAPASAFAGPCDPSARTLIGESAKTLVSALRMAGAKMAIASSAEKGSERKGRAAEKTLRYSAAEITCRMTNGGVFEDGLSVYECPTAPSKARANAANAEVLFEALGSIGVMGESGMNKTIVSARDVRCSIIIGENATHQCELTAVWAESCQP